MPYVKAYICPYAPTVLIKMKAFYKTTDRQSESYRFTYDLIKAEYCCNEMKEAFEDKAIFFGEFDSLLNEDTNVNIYRCNAFPEGACWDEYAIKYCPFCNEKIETIEKKRVKLVESKIRKEIERVEYHEEEFSVHTSKQE